MTRRDDLIKIIRTLPEDDLALIEQVLRELARKSQRISMSEALEKADAFRASMEDSSALPDMTDLIDQMREERLNDILPGGLH